jgi:hypothetical protein
LLTDPWTLDLIQKGHSIEFSEVPGVTRKVRWTTLNDHKKVAVLLDEIQALLSKDAIEPVDPLSPGYYSTFFVVPKRDGGYRPILNLKPLNRFVQKKSFKMETAQSVLQYLRQGDWLASLDLTDAYLHVPILPSHRKFLRFGFQGRVFQFKVLPFGLTSAPRVFTSVLAPLVGVLHKSGVQFIPYLDDCLLVASSRDILTRHVELTTSLLTRVGFLINHSKSHLVPSQDMVFLGMRICTSVGSVHLPEEKALRVVRCAEICFKSSAVTAHHFLQILGLMASCLRVVPRARLLMRPLQIFFLSRWDYKSKPLHFRLSIPDSLFLPWMDLDHLVSGVPLQVQTPTKTITTDASTMGWGGHTLVHNKSIGAQGKWNYNLKNYHINCLELLAVRKTLQAFQVHLRGHTVLVMTDNTTVRQYITTPRYVSTSTSKGVLVRTLCALSPSSCSSGVTTTKFK